MTEQLMTITGLEFTENGRIIARGTVIREGEYDLPALLAAGGAQMGALRPMNGCPTGRAEAKLAGRVLRGALPAGGRGRTENRLACFSAAAGGCAVRR